MTHQEILTKAIEKAIAGGWKPFESDYSDAVITDFNVSVSMLNKPLEAIIRVKPVYDTDDTPTPHSFYCLNVIFNHDFAKALRGEKKIIVGMIEPWKYHLQQMVIADDPIKYLGENL